MTPRLKHCAGDNVTMIEAGQNSLLRRPIHRAQMWPTTMARSRVSYCRILEIDRWRWTIFRTACMAKCSTKRMRPVLPQAGWRLSVATTWRWSQYQLYFD